jgi:hypothetical protein
MRALLLLGLVAATLAAADKPMDLPCVTWEPLTENQNTPPIDGLFVAAKTWVIYNAFDPMDCLYMGDVLPCFASDSGSNTWGHHDYQNPQILADSCRTWINGSVYFSSNMYIPRKGPKWQTWEWRLTQKGAKVPANAIRYYDKVMARSTINAPGFCAGKGYTGWAHGLKDGTFGAVHFGMHLTPVETNSFEVAICKAYHPTPAPPTPEPATPAPATPQPTPLPNNKPYIRFGNAVPSNHSVYATISQGSVSYTWKDVGFGIFSGWVEIFSDGFGKITIYEATPSGAKGAELLSKEIPLTPGPLVVVVKDHWPPRVGTNIETIAASYVQPISGSGVRLFNLSPDTVAAGLKRDGSTLVNHVDYTIGSGWAPVPSDSATFAVFDDKSGKTLVTGTFTPPEAPQVFTEFLIGMNNATGAYGPQLVPLLDAPES